MALLNLHRLILCILLLCPLSRTGFSFLHAQSLPYYKSEKIIVGEFWMKNINTVQEPRILKSTQIGNATFNKAGKGYLLEYDNQGIAEYDTIVFTADGEIHAYALKNQFLRAREDYFISHPGETTLLDVLANDASYSGLELSAIPFEEGVEAQIQDGKVRLVADAPGLYHFYYTACDGSGHCDEAKVTVFVMDSSSEHDTIVLSQVIEQQLTLPLPDVGYELISSTIEHVYPDGEGYFDVDLFRRDRGENDIVFQGADGKSLLYRLRFIDKWGDNKLNTSDKVYLHPGKSVETSLTDNDLWVNIYNILSFNSDLQVTSTGGGRVSIQPVPGFSGKASFQYVTCAYPRCDTTRVDVYVDHFKPALDQFDIYVDPSVAYHIPFYTPSQDYQFSIEKQPKKGSLELAQQNHSLTYTPGFGFSGEDRAKIKYTYQTSEGEFNSYHYIRFLPSPHPFLGKCADCVWPGDTDENGVVDMADIGPVARYTGEKGPSRQEGSTWKGQWSYPWLNFENERLNHIDADGDGLISWKDLQVIVDYFGQTHGLYTAPVTWLDIPVSIDRSQESVSAGDELIFEFNVGDEDHELYNVTGFSTGMKIEGQELRPADVEIVRDENNWLKSHQPTMRLKAPGTGNGSVSASEFRVRSVGVKGYGTALKLRIIVEDEVEGFRTLRAKSKSLRIIFRDMKLHTGNGVIELPDQIIDVPVKPVQKPVNPETKKLQVYPNPAQDQVTVGWPAHAGPSSVEVLDLAGKRYIYREAGPDDTDTTVPLTSLSPGMYVLKCTTAGKTWNKKLTIMP